MGGSMVKPIVIRTTKWADDDSEVGFATPKKIFRQVNIGVTARERLEVSNAFQALVSEKSVVDLTDAAPAPVLKPTPKPLTRRKKSASIASEAAIDLCHEEGSQVPSQSEAADSTPLPAPPAKRRSRKSSAQTSVADPPSQP